jgi:hypothetical protein
MKVRFLVVKIMEIHTKQRVNKFHCAIELRAVNQKVMKKRKIRVGLKDIRI